MYGVRKWSRYTLLFVAVQFSQHHLLKRLSLFHWIFFLLCQRSVSHTQLTDPLVVGPFLGSLFCSIDPCVYFGPVPYCLDDYSFVIQPEVQNCDASSFGFLFQDCFRYLGLFWFHTNFRLVCSSSVKNAGVILIGIKLNMQIALGSIDLLTIFVLPIHEHGIFFHLFVSSLTYFISFL